MQQNCREAHTAADQCGHIRIFVHSLSSDLIRLALMHVVRDVHLYSSIGLNVPIFGLAIQYYYLQYVYLPIYRFCVDYKLTHRSFTVMKDGFDHYKSSYCIYGQKLLETLMCSCSVGRNATSTL